MGAKGGTSDGADEVTLSRKGASSPTTRGRKLRSTGTKAKAGVSNRPNSLSELKKQLEARTRELAEVRGHLSEALEQQTATSEVLRAITGSPGDLKPVFEAILTNARRLCEAKFGHLLIYNSERFRVAAVHAAPSILTDFLNRGPFSAGAATGLGPSREYQAGCPRCRLESRTGLSRSRSAARRDSGGSRGSDGSGGANAQEKYAGRCHRHLPPGGSAIHRPADRASQYLRGPGGDRDRERAAVRRNPGQESPARGGERAQVAVRRQHEPRAAHAAQCHHRADRNDGHERHAVRHGKGAGAAAAREPRWDSSPWPHQPGARPVEDRGRKARVQPTNRTASTADQRGHRHRRTACREEQEPSRCRLPREPGCPHRGPHAAAADTAQPAEQCLQVHQTG